MHIYTYIYIYIYIYHVRALLVFQQPTFQKSQHFNDFSAAWSEFYLSHELIKFVSNAIMNCRLLK